jgi:Tol biopolymer transport system component
MFKTLLKITLLFLFIVFWSCSGSKSQLEQIPEFQDQQLQAQVEELQNKIANNPQNPAYRTQLADLYHQNGRSADALAVFEEGLALNPNDQELKFEYAQMASQIGATRKALMAYKEILQSTSGNDYLDRIAPQFVDAFSITRLTTASSNEAYGCFSKDGDKIVYQSDQDGNWDLFEFTLSSQSVKQLTATAEHEENPVLSPDGNFIAYTSTMEDHRNVDFDLKVRDIFLFDLVNNRHTNVTLNSSDDWSPKYSKDGKYISFVSERDDLRDTDFSRLTGEIYIMENDGRFQLRLTKNDFNDGGPVIAPGSTEEKGTIYYDSDATGDFEIYKTDFKGEKVKQVTFSPAGNDVAPDVSALGDKIVYFSDRDGNYEIYMMNSDGSAEMRLTSNPSDDLNPVFSPDGNKVLFHSNRSGNYDLYLMDLTKQSTMPALYDVIANIDQALQSM